MLNLCPTLNKAMLREFNLKHCSSQVYLMHALKHQKNKKQAAHESPDSIFIVAVIVCPFSCDVDGFLFVCVLIVVCYCCSSFLCIVLADC